MSEAAIAIRGLRHTFPGTRPVEVLDGVDLEASPGRVREPRGSERVRQEHAPAGARGAARARRGRGADRRAVDDRGAGPRGLHAAEGPVAAVAQGDRERGAGRGDRGESQRRRRGSMRSTCSSGSGWRGSRKAGPRSSAEGMRQRLALLRTFLVPRHVLLLDEPFGALDAITRREMHQWLQEVWASERAHSALRDARRGGGAHPLGCGVRDDAASGAHGRPLPGRLPAAAPPETSSRSLSSWRTRRVCWRRWTAPPLSRRGVDSMHLLPGGCDARRPDPRAAAVRCMGRPRPRL